MKIHLNYRSFREALPTIGSKIGTMALDPHAGGLHPGHIDIARQVRAKSDLLVMFMFPSKELPAIGRVIKDLLIPNEAIQDSVPSAREYADHLLICPITKPVFNGIVERVENTPEYMQWIEDHNLGQMPFTRNLFFLTWHEQMVYHNIGGVTFYLSVKDIFFRRIGLGIRDLMESKGEVVNDPPRGKILLPLKRDHLGLLYEQPEAPVLNTARIALRNVLMNYSGATTKGLVRDIQNALEGLLPIDYTFLPTITVFDYENVMMITDGKIPKNKNIQVKTRIVNDIKKTLYEEYRFYGMDETKTYDAETLTEIT